MRRFNKIERVRVARMTKYRRSALRRQLQMRVMSAAAKIAAHSVYGVADCIEVTEEYRKRMFDTLRVPADRFEQGRPIYMFPEKFNPIIDPNRRHYHI